MHSFLSGLQEHPVLKRKVQGHKKGSSWAFTSCTPFSLASRNVQFLKDKYKDIGKTVRE
jgi:hypothetical protein